MNANDRVIRPWWWKLLIGIVQCCHFAFWIFFILVMLAPSEFECDYDYEYNNREICDGKAYMYLFAHVGLCLAVLVVCLGILSIQTSSVAVLKAVERIQIVVCIMHLFYLVRGWNWAHNGYDEGSSPKYYFGKVGVVVGPILLLAHTWMYWQTMVVADLKDTRIVSSEATGAVRDMQEMLVELLRNPEEEERRAALLPHHDHRDEDEHVAPRRSVQRAVNRPTPTGSRNDRASMQRAISRPAQAVSRTDRRPVQRAVSRSTPAESHNDRLGDVQETLAWLLALVYDPARNTRHSRGDEPRGTPSESRNAPVAASEDSRRSVQGVAPSEALTHARMPVPRVTPTAPLDNPVTSVETNGRSVQGVDPSESLRIVRRAVQGSTPTVSVNPSVTPVREGQDVEAPPVENRGVVSRVAQGSTPTEPVTDPVTPLEQGQDEEAAPVEISGIVQAASPSEHLNDRLNAMEQMLVKLLGRQEDKEGDDKEDDGKEGGDEDDHGAYHKSEDPGVMEDTDSSLDGVRISVDDTRAP